MIYYWQRGAKLYGSPSIIIVIHLSRGLLTRGAELVDTNLYCVTRVCIHPAVHAREG
jgi:hypothetical protein